eukprot:232045-Pelagomonas_calceolata.AAC.5
MYAEVWECGQLPSIMRHEHAKVRKASHEYALHYQMARRAARVLPSQAKIGQSSSPIATI